MSVNPFKGLNPYSEKDQSNFEGREEEIEYLLQVIQKNKLVTLTGIAGSGKTSIILAGLMPRLKKGFLGQAGKDWSICYCRPGIAPIENFVQSLTFNGVLKMNRKSNTEDFDHYLNIIKMKGNLGLIDIYKNSEIYNKRNLLIIVDQMEDLFNLNPYLDSDISDEDDLMVEMFSRTVKAADTAIYVMLSIQSEYVSELINYSKLQEIRSKSQYSIQNINAKQIAKIIKRQFNKNKIYFDDNTINPIISKVSSDNALLINFQFLCFNLFEKFSQQNTNLTIDNINEVGGLEGCINFAYENFFKSKSEEEKIAIEKLHRSFIKYGEKGLLSRCQQIKNIISITGIEQKVLINLLFDLKNNFGISFDFLEHLISGHEINSKRALKNNFYVMMKYQRARSWNREKIWLDEEEENYEKYHEFASMTRKFQSGDGSLLISPELDLAVEWRNKSSHSLEWSKKYNEDYQSIIDYIDESDEVNKKKRKNEELKLKRRRKIARQVISAMSVLALFAFGMFIKASISQKDAKESEKIAVKKSILAQQAKEEAEKQTAQALINEEIAETEKDRAQVAKLEAEYAKNQAEIAKKQAEVSAVDARKQSERALMAEKFAVEQAKLAVQEKDKATLANDKILQLKNLAEIESDFYPSVIRLEKQITSNIENVKNDLDKETVLLISDALNKYAEFDELSNSLNLKSEVEGGYMLLQTALMVLEGEREYKNTSMKLKQILPPSSARSISSIDNLVVFGGDDGKLYLIDTSLENKISEINIKERIRSILLLDNSDLLVGTFRGNVYKVNVKDSFSKNNNIILNTESPIKDIYYDHNNKQTIVISENEINILNESFETISKNQIKQIITASFYKDQKLIIAQNNKLYYFSNNNLVPIIELFTDQKNIRISSLFISDKYLFAGKSNGEIIILDYQNQDLNTLKYLNKILLHRTQVTKLLYLDGFETLYSSSLDNQILKFIINENNIKNITNNYIALNGHSKWVWDLVLSKDKNGKNILVTVDEEGNVLTWYNELNDLAQKVKDLFKLF